MMCLGQFWIVLVLSERPLECSGPSWDGSLPKWNWTVLWNGFGVDSHRFFGRKGSSFLLWGEPGRRSGLVWVGVDFSACSQPVPNSRPFSVRSSWEKDLYSGLNPIRFCLND